MKRNRRNPLDMPVEIWDEIISKLHHDPHSNLHLQSLSRVCIFFLSLTNRHKQTLKISNPTAHFLPSLLRRFPNLNHLSFSDFSGDPLPLLLQFAGLNYRLESLDISIPVESLELLPVSTLSGVKSLKIRSPVGSISEDDFHMIAKLFPCLEELDMSLSTEIGSYSGYSSGSYYNGYSPPNNNDYSPSSPRDWEPRDWEERVSEDKIASYHGLSVLASKLKGLRRVSLDGIDWVSDKGILSLSEKCPDLEEIVLKDCASVTKDGIRYALRECKNLKTVGLIGMDVWIDGIISRAMSLSAIDLSDVRVSDDSLLDLVEADLPLKSFALESCTGFTYDGISSFLKRYDSLDHLALRYAHFLCDESMFNLSKSLTKVRSVKLNYCRGLSDPTLFNLIKQCPLLETVEMMDTNLGKKGFLVGNDALKSKITTLDLSSNVELSNSSLRKIALACPDLETLQLRSCIQISTEGVTETLKNCPSLKHLEVGRCVKVTSFDLPEMNTHGLEFLGASWTGLKDNALIHISKKYPNLMFLNVKGCNRLTSEGMIEVVDMCTKLKEIYLCKCWNMTGHILAWMVFSRPSLRKIIPPSNYCMSAIEENLFMRHGCYVTARQY